MSLIGVSFGMLSNIRNAMWAEVYGAKHLGSLKSFASTLMVFSTAIAPPLGGWLLDHQVSLSKILWTCICLLIVATVLAFLAKTPNQAITL